MTQHFHGFYVHGKAPWEQSDIPAAWLKRELDREVKGKSQSRSFGAFSGMQQTDDRTAPIRGEVTTSYEIYMTKRMREDFDLTRNE